MSAIQSPFASSSVLFVEYHDIIKSPWLLMLYSEHAEDAMAQVLNTMQIRYLDNMGIYEWYKNRKNRNPLAELDPLNKYTEGEINQLLESVMNASDDFYTNAEPLEFVGALRFIASQKLCQRMVIYSEKYEKGIERDISSDQNLVNLGLEYVYGDIPSVIKDFSPDCTYVLSDITKLQILNECGRLNFASVMIASDYRYNYTDIHQTPKVDIKSIFRDNIIKYSTFISSKPSAILMYDFKSSFEKYEANE